MLLAQVEHKLREMAKTEVIETDAYTLIIRRSERRTSFAYQPKGFWTDVINGTIEVGGLFSKVCGEDGIERDVTNSSGGRDDSWTLDCIDHFIAAYQDCRDRVINSEEEVKNIRERIRLAQLASDIRSDMNRKREAEVLEKHSPLSEKQIRKVVKEAANLGEYGKLRWNYVNYKGEIYEKECDIKPNGIYQYRHSKSTQKSVVKYLLNARTISVDIVKGLV